MQELMANQKVEASISNYGRYLDEEKIKAALQQPGPPDSRCHGATRPCAAAGTGLAGAPGQGPGRHHHGRAARPALDAARLGKWRTPESTLHAMGLLGGWPGGLAAQRFLRHKSSKRALLATFWFTVVLNVLAAGYLVWVGDAGLINRLIHQAFQNAPSLQRRSAGFRRIHEHVFAG